MNLYILKCKNNKYYIGTTTLNTTKRLTQHMSGRGSAWTKKHPPLWIEKEITNCDKYDEDKWTKIYMDKYGIDNVRGGSYSQISLPSNMVNLLEREVNHANQNCLSCGKKGHFINRCPSREKPIDKKYKSKNLYYLNMSCDYESADGIEWEEDDEESEEDDEESEEDISPENLETAFREMDKDDGMYTLYGNTYLWYDGELYKESNNKTPKKLLKSFRLNSRFEFEDYKWKSIHTSTKKSSSSKCYRCGRNGHYASKCYAKKHIKGFYIKN